MAYMWYFSGEVELGNLTDLALEALGKYINNYSLHDSVVSTLEEIDEEDSDENYMGILAVVLTAGRTDISVRDIFHEAGRSFIDGITLNNNILKFGYHAADCGVHFFSRLESEGIIRGYRLYTPDWAIEEDDMDDEEIVNVSGGSMCTIIS